MCGPLPLNVYTSLYMGGSDIDSERQTLYALSHMQILPLNAYTSLWMGSDTVHVTRKETTRGDKGVRRKKEEEDVLY